MTSTRAPGHGTAPAGVLLARVLLYRAPVVAAGLVVATALLAALFVPFGAWRAGIVFPVLLVVLAGLVRLAPRVPAPAVPPWAALTCTGIAVAHGVWAALTHAEHVILRRDAGSYALYTQWIATRHELPVDAHLDRFGGAAALADPAFRLASPAFYSVVHDGTAQIVPQFLIGAPANLSLGWWVAGWTGVFVVPAVLSAFALLAAGGLTARLVGPAWAPLAVGVLAVAQPVIHAARSTYSEPAALLVVLVAAALLVDAVRHTDGRLALAAGAAFGLAGLIRVDALREVSLLLPVAAVLALRGSPLARPLVAGALAGTAVAAVPALLLSRPYLGDIAGSLVPLVGGGVVLGLGSLAAVRLAPRLRWGGLGRWLRSPAGPRFLGAAVVVLGIVLASRPLWLITRQSLSDPGTRVVAGLQLRQGLPVDGGRTYAEDTLNWIAWYLGPVAVVLAWLALAVLAARAVGWWNSRTGDVPAWLGPTVVAFGSVVLTLYRPGITPDHPWADRRMVPVVLPALVIASVAALAWAARRLTGVRRGAVVGVGCAVLLVPSWWGTAAVASDRTEVGEPAMVEKVCAALRPGDVVLSLDARAANEWPQLVRGVCGIPAASVKVATQDQADAPVRRIVARIAAAGGRPVLLAAAPDGAAVIGRVGLVARPVLDERTTEDQRYLERRPDGVDPLAVQVWLGRPR